MTAPALRLQGVSKHYGTVRAVDRVTLEVRPGEVYALLGLNGAGKTTVMRTVLGMVRPSAAGAATRTARGPQPCSATPAPRTARTPWPPPSSTAACPPPPHRPRGGPRGPRGLLPAPGGSAAPAGAPR